MSSLLGQIKEALVFFAGLKTLPALVGGLALASHGVVRATRDVDFLIDADDADRLHDILPGLGCRCAHRSLDAANYLRGEDGFDVLYAHRPMARRLLKAVRRIRCRRVHKRSVMHHFLMHPARFKIDGA
jgi:hypothetical protein